MASISTDIDWWSYVKEICGWTREVSIRKLFVRIANRQYTFFADTFFADFILLPKYSLIFYSNEPYWPEVCFSCSTFKITWSYSVIHAYNSRWVDFINSISMSINENTSQVSFITLQDISSVKTAFKHLWFKWSCKIFQHIHNIQHVGKFRVTPGKLLLFYLIHICGQLIVVCICAVWTNLIIIQFPLTMFDVKNK